MQELLDLNDGALRVNGHDEERILRGRPGLTLDAQVFASELIGDRVVTIDRYRRFAAHLDVIDRAIEIEK